MLRKSKFFSAVTSLLCSQEQEKDDEQEHKFKHAQEWEQGWNKNMNKYRILSWNRIGKWEGYEWEQEQE